MRGRFSRRGAFTLVEVMVAATILAFATFGLMGLLKLSDQAAFRARASGQAANIFKSRSLVFVSMPISYFRFLVSSKPASSPGVWTFKRGVLPASPSVSPVAAVGQDFPFFSVSNANDPVYFFKSRPLPEQTQLRSIFPYSEEVTLSFYDSSGAPASSLSAARFLEIKYALTWVDPFSNQTRALNFEFVKAEASDL